MIIWYIVRTFINATMHSHPVQQLKKTFADANIFYIIIINKKLQGERLLENLKVEDSSCHFLSPLVNSSL
jgi:hypothetical protein